jgi:hypothetical protein
MTSFKSERKLLRSDGCPSLHAVDEQQTTLRYADDQSFRSHVLHEAGYSSQQSHFAAGPP